MAQVPGPFSRTRYNADGVPDPNPAQGNHRRRSGAKRAWWPGSVFRMLILATFAEDDVHLMELWRRFCTRSQLTV